MYNILFNNFYLYILFNYKQNLQLNIKKDPQTIYRYLVVQYIRNLEQFGKKTNKYITYQYRSQLNYDLY
ncbi:hypothetical protein FGO68_gene11021 [Halteria grandinella]|uniref:Uncharacterized protein n=1 Tax=Halteria grandinella TaxID=5974 RepID=A0A8J8NAP4_HALGN|nr:hypothetical protein FGO68_gene11021 [Halteria grandinella]